MCAEPMMKYMRTTYEFYTTAAWSHPNSLKHASPTLTTHG